MDEGATACWTSLDVIIDGRDDCPDICLRQMVPGRKRDAGSCMLFCPPKAEWIPPQRAEGRLRIQRLRIVDICSDATTRKEALKKVSFASSNHVQVVYVGQRVPRCRKMDNNRVNNFRTHQVDRATAREAFGREPLQPDPEECGLQLIEAGVDAVPFMAIALHLTVVPEPPNSLSEIGVMRDDRTGIPDGSKVLSRIEAVGSEPTDLPRSDSVILCQVCLRGILNERDTVSLRPLAPRP